MKQIFIGKIVATSGIKGYVKINTVTESPNDLKGFEALYDNKDISYNIKRVISTKGNIAIVEIKGITSIDIAKQLVGIELFINRDLLDELPSNSYYYADLIGSIVYLDNMKYGEVVDVLNYGASDIIEIREFITNRLIMYPFVDDFISQVNINQKEIILREVISDSQLTD